MIAVIRTSTDPGTGQLVIELCPNHEDGACACPRNADGDPDPGHPTQHVADTRPAAPRRKTDPRRPSEREWVAARVADALELHRAMG